MKLLEAASWVVALFAALIAMAVPAEALTPSNASQIVTLKADPQVSQHCNTFDNVRAFDDRILPDGTSRPFIIPAGQVLVVTSGEIFYRANAGTPGVVQLEIGSPTGSPANLGPVISISSVITDSNGYAHELFSFSPGIVVSSGHLLCADNQGSSVSVFIGIVHGFLAPAR